MASRGRRASAAASMARQLVNRASVRPPAAAMSASSSSCIAGLEAGVARVGQVGGAVEQRVVLVVERAADVELRRSRRPSRPSRWPRTAAGWWRW